MANLIDIRRRIKSTKNTQQITKAMKMVSASRLRRAQERAENARPYAARLFDMHASILARMTEVDGGLYEKQEGQTLLVVVCGDKGLCGAFNSNILKRADQILKDEGPSNVSVLPVGNKAVKHFKKLDVDTIGGDTYGGVFRDISVNLSEEIGEILTNSYLSGSFGRVVLLFNKFKNIMVQEVTEWQVLPVDSSTDDAGADSGPEHLAEPSLEEILDDLTPRVITTRVYQGLLESCAAEHASRMTAMDAATNNAFDMINRLTLEMNKARQAAITTELIEVVSGAAAL